MKVLITGAAGMLGSEVCQELKRRSHTVLKTDINLTTKDIEFLDVKNYNEVTKLIKKMKPNAIFHLAAETDVDLCEKKPDHAYITNVLGTENIALLCQKFKIPMVYISTAGVFSGDKVEPYTEFDEPGPLNIYGKTKLEGEKIVQNLLNEYFIFRAGWMVGGWTIDKKFVYKIIKLLKTEREINVVDDKFGSPTFTFDFAKNLMTVVNTKRHGLFHMTNKGTCSRYDIAVKIIEFLDLGGKVKVNPVSSTEFPLPAPRARSEMMRNYKLDLLGLNSMPRWEESLARYIRINKDKINLQKFNAKS